MRDVGEKVVAAYLYPGDISGEFANCMLSLMIFDGATHRRIHDGGGILPFLAGHNLSAPRNDIVRKFLDFGAADWLWMVDSDMTFPPDVVEQLLAHADPRRAPIVGGLCFAFDEAGRQVPTLYDVAHVDGVPEVVRYDDFPPDAMFQVAATGAACLLIHRSALERIRDHRRDGADEQGFNAAFPWFQETQLGDRPVSEDITFCWRAVQAGMPVYVNTSVQIGHVKRRVLTVESFRAQQAVLGPRTDLVQLQTQEAS